LNGEELYTLKDKLGRVAAQLPLLPRALALVRKAAKGWFAAWIILLLFQGLLPVALVYLSRSVVNSLVLMTRTRAPVVENVWPALWPAILLAATLLATEVLRSATSYVRTVQSELVRDEIRSLIQEKSVAMDLEFYDSPEFYDHLHRAKDEAAYRPVELLDSIGALAQSSITLVAMGAVLLPFGAWLPVALLVGTLPAFWVVLRYSLLQHAWRRSVTTDERRTWYYEWLLTTAEPAAEIRLFNLGGYFQKASLALRTRLRQQRLNLAQRQALAETGAGAMALMVTGGSVLWVVWSAVQGRASLGDLVLLYQAFQQGLQLTKSLLGHVGQIYSNILFLGNLFEFLDLEPLVTESPSATPVPASVREGIRLHEVTFHYPGTHRVALDKMSVFLEAKRVTAIVGPNGAGKSTLIKLIARFYDPQSGRIEMDGGDLRDYALQELRDRITILFQQPVHFSASARENIAFGEVAAGRDDGEILAAARDAGAESVVRRLPDGLDTMLGRWFQDDGAELSVGEWQRLALARAFLRRSAILVLDEPTSAMDPWAESEWLERFRKLAVGRTVLIVTHRFTTAMFADVIHVMDAGRIVESGNHEELLRMGGRYAEAWIKQKRG
jgi:ATP-binding cassette, subfamily B, bacterial